MVIILICSYIYLNKNFLFPQALFCWASGCLFYFCTVCVNMKLYTNALRTPFIDQLSSEMENVVRSFFIRNPCIFFCNLKKIHAANIYLLPPRHQVMQTNLHKITIYSNSSGGGDKALAFASAKNTSFFYVLPKMIQNQKFGLLSYVQAVKPDVDKYNIK